METSMIVDNPLFGRVRFAPEHSLQAIVAVTAMSCYSELTATANSIEMSARRPLFWHGRGFRQLEGCAWDTDRYIIGGSGNFGLRFGCILEIFQRVPCGEPHLFVVAAVIRAVVAKAVKQITVIRALVDERLEAIKVDR